MANPSLEDAVTELESILRADFPDMLATIVTERGDGVPLPVPVEYHWEEVAEKLMGLPAVLLIPDFEVDTDARDILWDSTIQLYLVASDSGKKNLTKKMLRYAEAVKRILRKPLRRTLNQKAVSAKVARVGYSPTYLDRDNLYARDINAEIVIRISRMGG